MTPLEDRLGGNLDVFGFRGKMARPDLDLWALQSEWCVFAGVLVLG
jgi:hypothetical protein